MQKYLDDDTFTGATFLISGCAFAFALVVTACFLNPFIEARLPSKVKGACPGLLMWGCASLPCPHILTPPQHHLA
jgi:hypothetical protein